MLNHIIGIHLNRVTFKNNCEKMFIFVNMLGFSWLEHVMHHAFSWYASAIIVYNMCIFNRKHFPDYLVSDFLTKKYPLTILTGVGGYSYLYEPLWWVGMITSKFFLYVQYIFSINEFLFVELSTDQCQIFFGL